MAAVQTAESRLGVLMGALFLLVCGCSADPDCPKGCRCSVAFNNSISTMCTHPGTPLGPYLQQLLNSTDFVTLKSVTISNTDLSEIPDEICAHKELVFVNMSQNAIGSLHPSCLHGMDELSQLHMVSNQISDIPDHLFDNKMELTTVDFTNNDITTIGVNVFSNASDMVKLREISFRENKLRSIDPWPLIRMLVVQDMTIDFNTNNIETFTDNLGWAFNCDSGRLSGTIDLKGNNLKRLSDFQHGWQFPDEISMLCLFNNLEHNFRIQLEDNNYHCDCKEYEIIRIIRTYGRKSTTINQLICHTPLFPGMMSDPRMIQVPLTDLICDMGEGCPSGCTCTERPANRTIEIHCPKAVLTEMPSSYPRPYWNYTYRLEMQMQNNNIKELEDRSYYHNVYYLDLSHNGLRNMSASALRHLQEAAQIDLHNNNLSTLPWEVQNITEFAGSISLHQNPWECSCHTLWLKQWMLSIQSSLSHPEGILCYTPKRLRSTNMLTLPDADFICGDPPNHQLRNWLLIGLGSALATILILIVPISAVYAFRMAIYTRYHVRLFDWDECDGENKLYDVFLSYSEPDQQWLENLCDQLEEEHNFTCCIHKRDFKPSQDILEQIGKAIDASKRTLCVLSPSFLKSKFCVEEFKHAFQADVNRDKRRLIAVVLHDMHEEDFRPNNQIVRHYISQFTYLRADDPKFEEKLLYALPTRTIKEEMAKLTRNEETGDPREGTSTQTEEPHGVVYLTDSEEYGHDENERLISDDPGV